MRHSAKGWKDIGIPDEEQNGNRDLPENHLTHCLVTSNEQTTMSPNGYKSVAPSHRIVADGRFTYRGRVASVVNRCLKYR